MFHTLNFFYYIYLFLINFNQCVTHTREVKMGNFKELEYYETNLNHTTELECKTRQEWMNEELFFTKSDYPVRYKSAQELFERYQLKLSRLNKVDFALVDRINFYQNRINEFQQQIEALQNTNYKRKLRKAINKINYAKGELIERESKQKTLLKRMKHYEYLCKKWRGIVAHIETAMIFTEIKNEKRDLVAPKYGFGKPREESKFIHED